MSLIIDAHSHYMPPEVAQHTAFFKVHWSDIKKQLDFMDQYGVDQSVLLYPTSDAHLNMGGWGVVCQAYNKGVAHIIAQYPDRFIGAGILPIDNPDLFPETLKNFKALNLKMLSLASSYGGVYLDDSRFDSVYEFARDNNVPIHVHAQIISPIGEDRVRDPLLSPVLEYVFDVSMCIGKMMMEGTFLKYPDVKFIFAHYGGALPLVKERFDSTYTMLRRREFVKDLGQVPSQYFKNLYFDMSGSGSLASFEAALEIVDSSHILLGSDFPAISNLSSALDVLNRTSLSDIEKQGVKGGNLSALFQSVDVFS